MAGWTASSNCCASWMTIAHERSHRRNELTTFDSLEYFESWPLGEPKTICLLPWICLGISRNLMSWPSASPWIRPGTFEIVTLHLPPWTSSILYLISLRRTQSILIFWPASSPNSPRTIFISWPFTALIRIFVVFFQYQGHFRSWRLQVAVQ